MNDQQQRHLNDFVGMYGSRAIEAIHAYKKEGKLHMILTEYTGEVKPDMPLQLISVDALTRDTPGIDTNSSSVRLLLKQMATLNPEVQAPIGFLIDKREVLTHVVEFKKCK